MSRPLLLITTPMEDVVVEGCRDRFEVERLWTHEDPADLLEARGEEVRAVATTGGFPMDGELMARLPNLEIVANSGVGYDAVDTATAHRRGVVVTNTPGVLDEEVADTALALLIMTVRQLSRAERYLRDGRWPEGPFPLSPSSLSGRTVGVLGLGRIGEAIARRVEACGLQVAYHNRRRKDGVPYRYHGSPLDLARDVDTLVVTVPGGAETRHVVDREVLEALGPDGVLINVARGSVVDEHALTDLLQSERLLGAGLDVFEDEPHVPEALRRMEHVVLLPHVGSASRPTRAAMAQLVVDNLHAWFDGRPPLTPVPETPVPARDGHRD
jgi:lactate dehydrogenase-like 2-hydroxyacid dehydrogenase